MSALRALECARIETSGAIGRGMAGHVDPFGLLTGEEGCNARLQIARDGFNVFAEGAGFRQSCGDAFAVIPTDRNVGGGAGLRVRETGRDRRQEQGDRSMPLRPQTHPLKYLIEQNNNYSFHYTIFMGVNLEKYN